MNEINKIVVEILKEAMPSRIRSRGRKTIDVNFEDERAVRAMLDQIHDMNEDVKAANRTIGRYRGLKKRMKRYIKGIANLTVPFVFEFDNGDKITVQVEELELPDVVETVRINT